MKPTPSIITRTFDASRRVLCQETGDLENINVSSISTRLIQETGRFCERFASDFIISWDIVRRHLEPRVIEKPYRVVEIFGIRRSGVDHNSFFMSRLYSVTAEAATSAASTSTARYWHWKSASSLQATPEDDLPSPAPSKTFRTNHGRSSHPTWRKMLHSRHIPCKSHENRIY